MRRLVTGIKIDEAQVLIIEFEGDLRIKIPTDTSIVDWQWCLNRTGEDPYIDYIVACFDQSEIKIIGS